MYLLLETIQIRNGILMNLRYHQERMHESTRTLGGRRINFDLLTFPIPDKWQTGIVKCRILYNNRIEKIEFESYVPRQIHSLQMVIDNSISYTYKFADRSKFTELLMQKGDADDILIVKNGKITDTSFGNVVLCNGNEYYTPSSFLLNGTKRQQLLNDGIIIEQNISPDELFCMDKLIIINAMLDLDSAIGVNISSILKT
jgi:4-amino-4-deoxychorismate lyase